MRSLREGYSLVEVCLALLVVGLGIMAVFSLFPEGLGQSRRSVEATEMAAFADFVFSSLSARAATTNANPLWWENSFDSGSLNKTHALHSSDQELVAIQKSTAPLQYSEYYWKPNWYGTSAYIANYRAASFVYTLVGWDVGENAKGVRLEVWSGDVPTPPAMPGKVFYREFLPLR